MSVSDNKKKHTHGSRAQNLEKKNINDSYQWQTMIRFNLQRNEEKKRKIYNISILSHSWSLLSPRHIHIFSVIILALFTACAFKLNSNLRIFKWWCALPHNKLVFPLGEAKHRHFDKRSIQPGYFSSQNCHLLCTIGSTIIVTCI